MDPLKKSFSERVTAVVANDSPERISGIQSTEDEQPVDFYDVNAVETRAMAEKRRKRNRRLVMESQAISKRIGDVLETRWLDGAQEMPDIHEYRHTLKALTEGKVTETINVGAGANGTKMLEIEYGHELVTAFQKAESSELGQLINPANGDLITAHVSFERQPDGTFLRSTEFAPSPRRYSNSFHEGQKKSFEYRETFEAAYFAKQAKFYGLDPSQMPAAKTEYGLRAVEVGRSVVREYVCASVDAIVGFHVVPVTVLSTDGEELFSRQKGLKDASELAGAASGAEALIAALLQRKDHPAKVSLMRLAVLHDLVEHTDAHDGNVMLDDAAHGIDFGYSFPYHFEEVDGTVTSRDTIMSAAMQLVELDPSLKLDEAAMNSLIGIREGIADYLKYQNMRDGEKISGEERARLEALPEEVKKGEVAKLLSKLITMAYEVEGKPEVTAAIAKKEAELFMMRLDGIIKTGRPRLPFKGLKESQFTRIPELAERINTVRRTQLKGAMYDLDDALSDDEWAKKHIKGA